MTEAPRTLDQALGRVIARRRRQHTTADGTHLRQVDLAKLLGTSTTRVCNFEQGRQPVPIAYLWQVAGVLGCRVTDLVAEAERSLRAAGITPPLP